jgi:hypothetical protein
MMLKIPLESITEFVINNSEIPPEKLGDKFCRLDINMTINRQRVDLERPLEVTRHTELCDKQILHYYELAKLPKPTDGDEEIKFWLAFFKAETEEDLDEIIKKGVPVMSEAVAAYKSVTVSPDLMAKILMK